MNLLLDIGNTRIKAASENEQRLSAVQAVVHAGVSIDEALATLHFDALPQSVWVSCVAGPVVQAAVIAWAERTWGLQPCFVATEATACGVVNAYAEAGNLGVDRWLAVIAAHHRAAGAACVVDAGTCLTFDAVNAQGQHLGGLIAPGVTSQRSAVWGRTQVRAHTQDLQLDALAASTNDAVSFGTLHGPLGLIERVLAQVNADLDAEQLLLTGGEAVLLLPHLEGWEWAPDLVLEGLAVLANQNS